MPPTLEQTEKSANATADKDNAILQGLVNTQSASKVGSPESEKLLGSLPKTPTEQQDISSILEPYIKELTNLGPEYGSEMEYLKPYLLGTGANAPETFAQLEAGSKADESATGSKSVEAADAAAGGAIENQAAPGFGNLAKAGQEYEATLPYQAQIQAGLGYQKYLSTYGGLQPNTTGWNPQAAEAYQSIMGSSGAGGSTIPGLPPPTTAAADKAAATNATQVIAPSSQTGGSNG